MVLKNAMSKKKTWKFVSNSLYMLFYNCRSCILMISVVLHIQLRNYFQDHMAKILKNDLLYIVVYTENHIFTNKYRKYAFINTSLFL